MNIKIRTLLLVVLIAAYIGALSEQYTMSSFGTHSSVIFMGTFLFLAVLEIISNVKIKPRKT